jgi:hypothetical protein
MTSTIRAGLVMYTSGVQSAAQASWAGACLAGHEAPGGSSAAWCDRCILTSKRSAVSSHHVQDGLPLGQSEQAAERRSVDLALAVQLRAPGQHTAAHCHRHQICQFEQVCLRLLQCRHMQRKCTLCGVRHEIATLSCDVSVCVQADQPSLHKAVHWEGSAEPHRCKGDDQWKQLLTAHLGSILSSLTAVVTCCRKQLLQYSWWQSSQNIDPGARSSSRQMQQVVLLPIRAAFTAASHAAYNPLKPRPFVFISGCMHEAAVPATSAYFACCVNKLLSHRLTLCPCTGGYSHSSWQAGLCCRRSYCMVDWC